MRQQAKQEARWFITLVPVILVFLVIVMLGIAKNATPPDPNDPGQNPDNSVEIAEKNISELFWRLDALVRRKVMTPEESRKVLVQYATNHVEKINVASVRTSEAFRYAELLRTAERWSEAQKYFEMAMVNEPKNSDRIVNSRIRIAHCLAMQGKPEEAIKMAREAFDAPPGNKPSILLGVYMEVAPAARGQGMDVELARLIADAVDQHLMSTVDGASLPGQAFLNSRRHHIGAAFRLAKQLAIGDAALESELAKREKAAYARI